MKNPKIAVVGAGLCGTLLSIRLAQLDYSVDLFEKRPDLRKVQQDAGRSINLALSDRGLQALELVGIREQIEDDIIPMKGRMIHDLRGNSRLSPYSGRSSDYINSVSRPGLNAALLDMAETYENITVYFEYDCNYYDPDKNQLNFNTKNGQKEHTYDLVFGTDGAGSAIRQAFMMRSNILRFDYQQDFLTHGYKELEFPAADDGSYRIEPNALHIWPRDEYMMIALPNLDKSFTVTLFQAFDGPNGFDELDSPEIVRQFFENSFPDAIPHMPDLINDFFGNPTSSLGTIKCAPWHIENKVMLIGDAAHAIVPFYGQGMNCAFEDVFVLDQFIQQYNGNWNEILPAYSKSRRKDTDAIADLALDNFLEMQDRVNDEDFMQKRALEMELEQEYPDYFSKYSLVTFREDLPYYNAMKQGRFQDEYLLNVVRQHEDLAEINIEKVYKDIQAATRKNFNK